MKTKPALHFGFGVRGEFDLDIVKCDADGNPIPGTMRRVVEACPNLITNNGLSLLNAGGRAGGANVAGTIANFMAAVGVGTGNATPAFTDTAFSGTRVAVQAATTSTDPQWVPASTDTVFYQRTYTFAVGAATGNLSEIGLYVNTDVPERSLLTTRALILVGGIPGSITVLSDEQLIVTYRLYVTATIADSVLVTTQKGTEYTLTLRMSNMGLDIPSNNTGLFDYPISPVMNAGSGQSGVEAYYGASVTLGAATEGVTATSATPTQRLAPIVYGWSFLTVNTYRDDVITLALTTHVLTDIGAWRFSGNPFFVKVGVSPKVTKTNLDIIRFTVRTTVTRT